MPVEATPINGLYFVGQPTHVDNRGFFRQTWVASELAEVLGHVPQFVQGNHARSHPGVIRGFHAEPWDKLVYVASGRLLAVVADLRTDEPTFGTTVSTELGDGSERLALYITRGLGNAYCVLGSEPVDYIYDVTVEWTPDVDKRAVRWDDPTLAVDWPVVEPILSEDDRTAPTLRARHPSHPRFRDGGGE